MIWEPEVVARSRDEVGEKVGEKSGVGGGSYAHLYPSLEPQSTAGLSGLEARVSQFHIQGPGQDGSSLLLSFSGFYSSPYIV